MADQTIVSNKKAVFEYNIETRFEAGIVLFGTEIKAIRLSLANLADSYCMFINDELWVKGMHISEYKEGSYNNHIAKRDRKLLLNRNELKKLRTKMKEKGYAIIPIRLYISDRGFAKLEMVMPSEPMTLPSASNTTRAKPIASGKISPSAEA